jgi:hypothetical protein
MNTKNVFNPTKGNIEMRRKQYNNTYKVQTSTGAEDVTSVIHLK